MRERPHDLALIVAIAGMLFLLAFTTCEHKKKEADIHKTYSDSITRIKNKHGQEVAKQEVLILESREDVQRVLSESRYKDELIVRLLEKDKKATQLIAVNTITRVDTVLKTQILRAGNCDIMPIYRAEIKNEWIDLQVTSGPDSTPFKLQITNKLDIVKKEEKRKTIVEVTQLNPYSTTSNMQSIELEKKKPKKGLKIAALIISFIAGVLIAK